jgi:23S rRNA pseudouridine2605 synthase
MWAARITDPVSGPDKIYHVQVDRVPGSDLLERMVRGVVTGGERLSAKAARCLRSGKRHAWLEIVLDEGRNRHIRRLLTAFDVSVLRLVRVAIGPVPLGDLPKGAWRELTQPEISLLCGQSTSSTDNEILLVAECMRAMRNIL